MEICRNRRVAHSLVACAFAAALLLGSLWAAAQTTRPIQAVVRVGMTVGDMDRSVDFYTKVLDFKPATDVEIAGEQYEHLYGVFGMRARVVTLTLGRETLELTEYLTPQGRVVPRDSRSNDRWFQHIAIVTTDLDAAYKRLRENKVRYASTGPQRLPDWNPNAGGIRAFYFKDPDDHVLETIWFPPGKGNPDWHNRKELFPGIDHTAIVVADTDRSLVFYRDTLGMKVVGGSENYGTEQEHLNNVFGARLRITTLHAPAGPGIELLEYLSPRDGRPYPADAKSNDLFNWTTTLLAEQLPPQGAVHMNDRTLGITEGVMVRDPDGHAMQLVRPLP
jgi:catechol 2,3-dioxygenase-like lactoylglutathione lyase family enzyme